MTFLSLVLSWCLSGVCRSFSFLCFLLLLAFLLCTYTGECWMDGWKEDWVGGWQNAVSFF